MPGSAAYIPGTPVLNTLPLARYLPPIEAGAASAWLLGNLDPGSVKTGDRTPAGWVLDPFGASPNLTIEIARAGYRVLAAVNNPITRFLIELAANPPDRDEFNAALADIGAAQKGDERIEPHIRSLYQTTCAQCENTIEAQAFIWNRNAPAPTSRIYQCPYCKDNGERPVGQDDVEMASRYSAKGLHWARALERVASLDDPDRKYVEDALATYPPRAVYALFTLINKLEGLSPIRRRHMEALLLAAMDQANTLWPHPTIRARPKQLTIPPHYREHNVWLALEKAILDWTPTNQIPAQEVQLTTWPEVPNNPSGICLFEGRIKDLVDQLSQQVSPDLQIKAILTALPRPNQAFWTLCALWAGWLWGHDAAAPFKSVLRRRRYDWGWHCTALRATFTNLSKVATSKTPFLGLIGESEPGFLTAAIVAADMAGFDTASLAQRAESRQTQISWLRNSETQAMDEETLTSNQNLSAIHASVESYLRSRGEPASYMQLHSVSLLEMSATHVWRALQNPPAEALGKTQNVIQQALAWAGLARFGGSEQSLETGQWWLRTKELEKETSPTRSLSDRTEIEVVHYLQKNPGCTFQALDTAVCKSFTGLLTPEFALVQECLASYGEQTSAEENRWQLCEQDTPTIRRGDLAEMKDLLWQIGKRLGYEIYEIPPSDESRPPIAWSMPDGTIEYIFHLSASALLGKFLFKPLPIPDQGRQHGNSPHQIIVLPGSRASLIAHKLNCDKYLKQTVDEGWQFVKFRHLRRLADISSLSRVTLPENLLLDPLLKDDPQMRLL